MFDKYYQAVQYLESLSNISRPEYMQARFRNEFYLKRAEELVKRLKIKLNDFQFIHIAGTSGKGSIAAMVHEILNSAGRRVGSFYSPHPTSSIERIKVGDKYIGPDDFVWALERIKPRVNEMQLTSKCGAPSYFEIFLAMALLYFSKKKCKYAVLETGCGGEFDATNIIQNPKICAITNVGYDHMELLGRSLEKIARTKAGIIKKGSIFITSEKRPRLLKIFHELCKKKGAEYRQVGNSSQDHLEKNGELASEIGEILGIEGRYIEQGIKKTKLSCRFETIQTRPRVVLDGAHNYDKLKSTFNGLKELQFDKLFLIASLNKNKEVTKIIKMVGKEILSLKKEAQIYITRHLVAERTCADLKYMYNLLPDALRVKKEIVIDPWQALERAMKKARQNDLVLITGSFYLAGELRKKWVSQEAILKNNK